MPSCTSGASWKQEVAIVGGIVGAIMVIGGIGVITVLICRYGVTEHVENFTVA